MPRKTNTATPVAAANALPAPEPSPTDGEINAASPIVAATIDLDQVDDPTGKDEDERDDAPPSDGAPFVIDATKEASPEANTEAQLAMPLAAIDVALQGDVPLELGNVEARAKKPDGSEVVVTSKGKYRRAASGEPWLDTILLSS